MIKIRHNTVLELSDQDKRQIADARNEKREYVSQVLRFLEGLGRSDELAKDMAILHEESFLEIPTTYRNPADGEQLRITDGRQSDLDTRNTKYEIMLRQQDQDNKRVQQRIYSVPIRHPLPTSFDAQGDLRYGTNETRPGASDKPSDMAPLFSEYHGELSAEDRVQLKFLNPGSARNEAEVRIAARPHYRCSDPSARTRYNEPSKMPKLLGSKVDEAHCVPSCYNKPTRSSRSLFFGEPLPPREPAPSPYWRY